jgi:hypothetical protein
MTAPNFTHLAAWLVGANDDHPLLIERIDDDVLAPLDEMLGDLERAQPLRLARKRRSFQALKSFDALVEMRAELLTAALLTRIGSHFDFGADHPDLLLGDDFGGIEVGTRRLDGPRRLFELLDEVARQTDLSLYEITLTFDRRVLKISDERIRAAIQEIGTMVTDGVSEFRVEDIGLNVEASEGFGQITMFNQALGVPLGDVVPELIREFQNKIVEKRRQASTVPTMLLLDFSRVGDAWMIGNETWARELQLLLDAEPAKDVAYYGFGLMISSIDQFLPTKLAAVVRSDAPEALHEAFAGITRLFDSARARNATQD